MKNNRVLGSISLTGQGSEKPAVAQSSFGQGWEPSSLCDPAITGENKGLLVAVVRSWVVELDEGETEM